MTSRNGLSRRTATLFLGGGSGGFGENRMTIQCYGGPQDGLRTEIKSSTPDLWLMLGRSYYMLSADSRGQPCYVYDRREGIVCKDCKIGS